MTALFVLFGLLLNVAGGAGQLDRDPRAARLGSGEIARTASGPRLASRIGDDRTDHDEIVASLPPEPRLVSLAAFSYPAGSAEAPAAAPLPLDPSAYYRARAPPAA